MADRIARQIGMPPEGLTRNGETTMPEEALHTAILTAIDQALDSGVSDERIAEMLADAVAALREELT